MKLKLKLVVLATLGACVVSFNSKLSRTTVSFGYSKRLYSSSIWAPNFFTDQFYAFDDSPAETTVCSMY